MSYSENGRKSPASEPSSGDEPKIAGFFAQLTATVRRQFTQKKRMPCGMCVEILLPVVFALGIYLGSLADRVSLKPSEQFVVPFIPPVANQPYPRSMLQNEDWVMNSFCYNGSNSRLLERLPSGEPPMLRNCSYGLSSSGQDGLQQCHWGPNGNTFDPNEKLLCTDDFSAHGLPPGFCIWASCAGNVGRSGMGTDPLLIWSIDAMTLMRWAAAMAYGPIMDGFSFGEEGLRIAGRLVLVPDNAVTQAMDAHFRSKYVLYEYIAGPRYNTYSEAVAAATSSEGEGKTWGVLSISSADLTSGLSFFVSLNKSSVMWTNDIRERFSGGGLDRQYSKYVSSGFLTLQQAVSEFFMSQIVGIPTPEVAPVASVPMGFPPYRFSVFLQIAGNILCQLFMVLAYLYPVSQLAKRIVEEKELRLREATMVMGLGKFALFSSWLVTYFIQGLITSALITLILAQVLAQSQASIIFILFSLFTLSSILLSCLLSTFFSKSSIVALVVPLLYFLVSIPSFSLPKGTSRGTYLGLSIFSPNAFGIGIQLLFSYEINRGFGYKDFTNTLDTVNMATAMGMLVFDCVLYIVLTLYFDEVLPSEWGTKRHPLFFLPCFWGSKHRTVRRELELSEMGNRPPLRPGVGRPEAVEEYPSGDASSDSVHLNHIRREFDSHGTVKVAVDDLEMRLFPNQITVLLGHNGAGKTTAINLLTGMLDMTSGDCFVYGKSVRHNLRAARSEIGFCPQHNVLWSGLTVLEHLQYFARLKGVPSSKVDSEVESIIARMDLTEKRDCLSESLSGGQKRKLSVAIAIIGHSRLILLDEPTAGMDVGARRATLNLLKEMAAGRTILITTHYMDEADALGNRIAIMSKGNLHSYGSPMFLKTRLGTGYVLKVTLPHADEHSGELLRTVSSIVPSAQLKDSKGSNEVAIQLPIETTSHFSQAIGKMEDPVTVGKFGITGISLSVSTLEDVFLRIAREEELNAEGGGGDVTVDEASVRKLDEHYSSHSLVREPSFLGQLRGLLLKRLRYSRRDRRTVGLQILLPIACVALAMVLSTLGPPGSPPLLLDDSMYGGVSQQVPLCGCNTLLPSFSSTGSPLPVVFAAAAVNQTYAFSNALIDTYNDHGEAERNIAMSCYDPDYNRYVNRTSSGFPRNSSAIVVTLFNSTSLHSLPQSVSKFAETSVNAYLGRARTAANYLRHDVINYPLPFSGRQQQSVAAIQALVLGIFILIPFTFVPSTYVAFVVRERATKAKHLQLVCGVGHMCYWTSNFLFDLLSYAVTELMAIIIFFLFSKTEYIGAETIGPTIVIFLLYGLSCIPAAYAFSFIFDNHSSAQNFAMLGNFFSGFVLVLVHYVLKLIPSTKDIAKKIVWAFRFIPSFCLGEGVISLAQAPSLRSIGNRVDPWSFDTGIGYPVIFLAGEIFFFFALTLALEMLRHPSLREMRSRLAESSTMSSSLSHSESRETGEEDEDEDEDVAAERVAVDGGDPNRAEDVLTSLHLQKVYPDGKTAVRDVTFGVKKGEVFGFLGTNGAGKTTTMSILTSDLLPTRGVARICGSDVVSDVIGAQRHIGFCPQFDALLDLLTAEEHLHLFASLRGIPADQSDFICEALMEACKLDRVSFAKDLSGGNRRKLSVAISLIGAPEVLLLDEPSAGMDPKTRRQLWDVVLVAVKHNSSVVLTTHHLEEVDALAHRVAIMVDGSLRCIGSVDHLKKKFGSGIEIMVKGRSRHDVPRLQAFMSGTFPRATLLEDCNLRLTYRVPTEAQPPLSNVFSTLEAAKAQETSGMEDYTVQQTSLEQVFLRISGQLAAGEAKDEGAESPLVVSGKKKKAVKQP